VPIPVNIPLALLDFGPKKVNYPPLRGSINAFMGTVRKNVLERSG